LDEIVPSRAWGRYVFNAGAAQSADNSLELPQQSQAQSQDEEEQSDVSQPFSDWSQSNFGESQSLNLDTTSSSQPTATQSAASQATQCISLTPATAPQRITPTPASALKRSPSDDVEAPLSSKRSKITGPESILALGRSVEGIGKVIETVLAPPKSSAISPTKKVEAARKMAMADLEEGYISAGESTCLHILFGRDVTAADAYISDETPLGRAEIGRELINPTQNFNYHYSAGQSKSTNLIDHLPGSWQVIGKLLNDGKSVFTSKWFIWHKPISLKLKNKF
jgi:hypothetical protein